MKTFDLYGKYYNLLYSDKNYPEEAEYIKKLLTANNIFTGEILEFGSGTGKHGALLAGLGYKVHGIDQSREMISLAPSVNGFTCEVGDITSVSLGRTFDCVISLFHVMSYQISNEKVMSVFKNAEEHLKAGGIFIFDFWYSPAVYSLQPQVRIKRISDDRVQIIRLAEPKCFPNENRVDVEYTFFATSLENDTIQTFNEIHAMRHFSLLELDIVADNFQLDRITSEEFVTGNYLGENTWNACVVFKKKRK